MTFSSERLRYVKFMPHDVADYKRWYMNDEVMRYITGKGLSEPEADARFRKAMVINDSDPSLGFFAARDLETAAFIGVIKMVWYAEGQLEVGYGMLPEFWNNGYASEMLNAMISYAATLNAGTLLAIVNENHEVSKKVLLKFDFKFQEMLTDGDMHVAHYIRPIKKE